MKMIMWSCVVVVFSERMELLSMTHATFSQLSVDYSRKLTENAANLDHLKLTECRLWEEERNETSEVRLPGPLEADRVPTLGGGEE